MAKLFKYSEAVRIIKSAILQSRYQAARLVNKEQLQIYYDVGNYVSINTRTGKWGTGAIEEISRQLQIELPGLRGYSASNIKYMRAFFEEWNGMFTNRHLVSGDFENANGCKICHLPSGENPDAMLDAFLRVGFTHHREIISKCKSLEGRWYYIMRCASEFWNVDTLKEHLKEDDYSHYGSLPNNFNLTIPDVKLAERAVRSFKDEYLLDYINIEEAEDPEVIDDRLYNKRIISDIRKLIMTFGDGFCPISSEYRVIIEEQEYFIDILLFSRELNCLVAIELKRESFKPAYLGQLNFYLSVLDDVVRKPHENNSIGLLLCKDAKKAIVELAVRDFSKPMGVATYRALKNIPDEYKSLKPFITGVHEILNSNNGSHEVEINAES